MRYLMLFPLLILLFSCEGEDDIQLMKGDYILQSYTKVDCNSTTGNLAWKGIKSDEEEFSVSGTLKIRIFSIFNQELKFLHNDSNLSFDIKFIGAFSQIEGNDWIADFSDSPFEDGECETADIKVYGDTLTWNFIDSGGCEIEMIWEKG